MKEIAAQGLDELSVMIENERHALHAAVDLYSWDSAEVLQQSRKLDSLLNHFYCLEKSAACAAE